MAKRPSPSKSAAGRMVPRHLRPRLPEVDQYEAALAELIATAKAAGHPVDSAPIPDALRAVLPDCTDLEQVRQVLPLLKRAGRSVTATEVFRTFAALRVLSESDRLADIMAYLVSSGCEHAESADKLEVSAARCFAAFAGQSWQSGSLFPSHAEDYAGWVRRWLETRVPHADPAKSRSAVDPESVSQGRVSTAAPTDEDIRLLEKILLSGGLDDHDGDLSRCGFMGWCAADPDAVARSEYALRYGLNSEWVTPSGWRKYAEFEQLLDRSSFAEEWSALKRRFPAQTESAETRVFHRTLMRERQWQGEAVARFETEAQKFQALFDLLCWKYCLWGVESDRPLLMKPTVNLTPYGTQVFIPAFMSIDHKRDLNLKHLTALHRARGVRRQGEAFAQNREDSRRRALEAAEAADDAAENGIRGEARIEHISRLLAKNQVFDGASISRMTKRGRKIREVETRRKSQAKGTT